MKTKILIICALVNMLWGNLAYSQPVVRVYLAEDSSEVYQQALQYLQHFDITEDVFIAITFSEQMPNKVEGMTYCAQPVKPFPYQTIRVRIHSGLSKKEKKRVLAHEMIHVKQYVKSELELIDNHSVKWKGKTFRNYFIGRNQRFSPWEREAYRTDRLLLKNLKESTNQMFLAEDPSWFANRFGHKEDSVGTLQIKEFIDYDNVTNRKARYAY